MKYVKKIIYAIACFIAGVFTTVVLRRKVLHNGDTATGDREYTERADGVSAEVGEVSKQLGGANKRLSEIISDIRKQKVTTEHSN